MTDRFYSFEIIIYATPNEILKYEYPMIRHYLMAYHDKDINEDGTFKKAHTHMYITTKQNLSFNSCANLFLDLQKDNINVLPQNICLIKGTLKDCTLYATHENAPEKYQYSKDILISDNLKYFENSTIQQDNTSYQIICDILANESFRNLAMKYGREIIINRNAYFDFVEIIAKQENINFNYTMYKVNKVNISQNGEIIEDR